MQGLSALYTKLLDEIDQVVGSSKQPLAHMLFEYNHYAYMDCLGEVAYRLASSVAGMFRGSTTNHPVLSSSITSITHRSRSGGEASQET